MTTAGTAARPTGAPVAQGRGMSARTDQPGTNEEAREAIYSRLIRAGTMALAREDVGAINIQRCERGADGNIDLTVEIWSRSGPRPEPTWILTGPAAAIFLAEIQHPLYDPKTNRIIPVIMESAMAQGQQMIGPS